MALPRARARRQNQRQKRSNPLTWKENKDIRRSLAGLTQLVECQLPKLNVGGSNPLSRSRKAKQTGSTQVLGSTHSMVGAAEKQFRRTHLGPTGARESRPARALRRLRIRMRGSENRPASELSHYIVAESGRLAPPLVSVTSGSKVISWAPTQPWKLVREAMSSAALGAIRNPLKIPSVPTRIFVAFV